MVIKRALVTGGAGFIGSHVVDALVSQGTSVEVLDLLTTGRRANLNPAATFHQVDLRSRDVGTLIEHTKPEVVFHLGAQSSVVVSVRDPMEDVTVNVVGMVNLLQACVTQRVRKVVFASSGGTLYGEPQVLPCPEDHPIRPMSPYGASKESGEAFLRAFGSTFGLSGTALRLGNVYGPRQDPNGEAGVIAIFGGKMLRGEPVTIFGRGDQERDYVHVRDVAHAFVIASEESASEVYNVGTGAGTTVNALFKELAALTGYSTPPVHADARPGEVFRVSLDSGKLEQRLGWRPSVGLKEGLAQTVEWLRRQPS
ncbi:MAG: NAD-dependent epimerase/dehydratase family protein [SAR202 cluster bacterium]|nr:NAD-dependent epimerase/dehydratase family protein [SAR202 cluster bacterium]